MTRLLCFLLWVEFEQCRISVLGYRMNSMLKIGHICPNQLTLIAKHILQIQGTQFIFGILWSIYFIVHMIVDSGIEEIPFCSISLNSRREIEERLNPKGLMLLIEIINVYSFLQCFNCELRIFYTNSHKNQYFFLCIY